MSCYILGGGRREGLPNRCCDRAQRCTRRLLPRGAAGARQGLTAAHRRRLAGAVQCARPPARRSADGRSGCRGGGRGAAHRHPHARRSGRARVRLTRRRQHRPARGARCRRAAAGRRPAAPARRGDRGAVTAHAGVARRHYGVTLAVLALAALAYALLQTMVAPALPEIQHELGASTTSVTWVLTVYLLTASVATPILGRLGDMFGKERTLVAVLALFALGSLISAISHSLPLLVAGRAVQGAGGAVFPLAFGIIRDEFPRERVATGIGLISATFGIGGGAGLALSGVIVDHLSYRWIFWFGLVAVAVAMVTTHLFVPESPVKSPARIDWTGAALLSAGLVCMLLAVSQGNDWGWDSARIVGLFAAAAVIFLLWVRFERRQPEPLVDIELLRRQGVWTTNLTGLLIGFGMFGSFILIPQFVQTPEQAGYGFGADVTAAGLFLLPAAAVKLVAG